MPYKRKKLYGLPINNLIGSIVPTFIVTWYFLDKIGQDLRLRLVFISIAVGIQALVILVSNRTRRTRRSFFWGAYDLITGNGKLPARLFVVGVVIVATIAIGFEISGVKSTNVIPQSLIARYVEFDLYWTALNFLGMSDNTIEPKGFSKVLTLFAASTGLLFWGVYISLLINKRAELEDIYKRKAPIGEFDMLMYNEPPGAIKYDGNDFPVSSIETPPNNTVDVSAGPTKPKTNPLTSSENRLFVALLFVSGLVFWGMYISILISNLVKRKN